MPIFREGSSITTDPAATGRGSDMSLRHQAASLALAATIALTGFKLVVAHLSGSVGVFSEGIHSFLDLVSAALSFFTVREAGKPADEDHPFGHGKIETLSSLFESLLLVVAAGLIFYEAVDHLHNPHPVAHQGLAMATIFASLVVSYWVFLNNRAAARRTESSALHVNALHFLSDVVASGAVLIALVLLKITGLQIIDPLMAFGVAAYILVISAKQVKRALVELSDTQLPNAEIESIRGVMHRFQAEGKVIEAHDLRTRQSGATRHVDFHLVVCGEMSVVDSHNVCDEMESKIQNRLPTASVNIHVEPCEHHKTGCRDQCPIYIYRDRKGLQNG